MKLGICGFGYLSERFYLPAFEALQGRAEAMVIFDPSESRRKVAQASVNPSDLAETIDAMLVREISGIIIGSPSSVHAEQSMVALRAGKHVLCEKPMASTVEEAEAMIAAAERSGKLLAIGLFRRFFPSTQAIKEIIENWTLGNVVGFSLAEGGLFNWPAASSTFFSKEHSGGGVLHDLGVHTLDLMVHWFGEPNAVEYEDDAEGGLETNCLARFDYGEFQGDVRLSRDWSTANRYFIQFEKGWVSWNVGDANRIEMGLEGCGQAMQVNLCELSSEWGRPSAGRVGLTYSQAFTAQLQNFINAIQGTEDLKVPGTEGIRSLRLIERCYGCRRPMAKI